MALSLEPTSPNIFPISSRPLAIPHFGNATWASVANSSRMLSPVDVTPPLSNAFRYSSATDLRCSSVMVSRAIATAHLLVAAFGRRELTPPGLALQLEDADHPAVVGRMVAARGLLAADDVGGREPRPALAHDPVDVVVPAGVAGQLGEAAAGLLGAQRLEARPGDRLIRRPIALVGQVRAGV